MKFKLLSARDMEAIDALKQSHGGAKKIAETIEQMRKYETRKGILAGTEYGPMIQEAEELVKGFAKVEDFEEGNGITYKKGMGTATAQVSGFQGARVTHRCMKRVVESVSTEVPALIPAELISVVALTEEYVYHGNLMATLAMAENIMGVDWFCTTNLVGTPLPVNRFQDVQKATGVKFDTEPAGDGLAKLILMNQGTFFGNFGGIEVANDNHLLYLDGITRAAKTTGANFFLNPSWSSIVAVCYYARDIPNLYIKVSMLLSTQNLMQFRMLLNIVHEYLRDDKTSPIREINIGNGVSPENFIRCSQEAEACGIEGLDLAAHILINPDLGRADFDWFDNSLQVLESGTDLTFKYESDGQSREYDTMEAYFLPEGERKAHATEIGDVIYYKTVQCTKHAREYMRRGIPVKFGRSSHR
ncbi:MAG: hypothetical protein WCD51_00595 [Anaerolineae bacterium]